MTKTTGTPDIGILGTGRMGPRLAAMFARAGRKVILSSRDPARADALVRELAIPNLRSGSHDDALRAPAILPAIFIRDGLFDFLRPIQSRLAGKLLIDISNPFNDDYSDFLTPWTSSGAEQLALCVPHARIVGAFKHVFWDVLEDPWFEDGPSDVMVVGDDEEAKRQFIDLAEGTPFRYLDAGPLIHARTVERLTMITGRLGRQIGSYPRMNWKLLGDHADTVSGSPARSGN